MIEETTEQLDPLEERHALARVLKRGRETPADLIRGVIIKVRQRYAEPFASIVTIDLERALQMLEAPKSETTANNQP